MFFDASFRRQKALFAVLVAMLMASVMPVRDARGEVAGEPSIAPVTGASEPAACRGVDLPLQECLKIVDRIGRFLAEDEATQQGTSDGLAETVCEGAKETAPACRDSVAKMKDWSAATFGSSLPPRSSAPRGNARQWRAPSVSDYGRQ